MGGKRGKVVVGNVYGRLTVKSFSRRHVTACGGYLNYWNCVCECGSDTEVTNRNLTSGHTLSCGCLRDQINSKVHTVHGYARKGQIHPVHAVWRKIIQRCDYEADPRFHRYGGRGIKLCDRWRVFENFAEDMMAGWKPGLTVERKDNDGDYCPENCTWDTRKVQANNRSTNVCVEIDGKRFTMSQLSEKIGINAGLLRWRMKMRWPIERLIVPPTHKQTVCQKSQNTATC